MTSRRKHTAKLDGWRAELRRLFSEGLGTFFLVLAACGAEVVDAVGSEPIGRAASVTAPGLTVVAVILFMGEISGAHLNPAVTLAFALRGDFPWRRAPGYLLSQLGGAVLACLFLWAVLGKDGRLGATAPGPGISDWKATAIECVLTLGLVTTILGTASSAHNLGGLSAIAVGGYIVLAGLWSSPISGASMNPARSFGPALVLPEFSNYWVYVIGPLAGAIGGVLATVILRGSGPREKEAQTARGTGGE